MKIEPKQIRVRKAQDFLRYFVTCVSTLFGAVVLAAILIYIFIQGSGTLSWDLIVSDYKSELVTVRVEAGEKIFQAPIIENAYFSEKYGIALRDSKDAGGEACITLVYMDDDSPFHKAICIDNTENNGQVYALEINTNVSLMMGEGEQGEFIMASIKDGAEKYIRNLDLTTKITSVQCTTSGGGIRGSLLTTFMLIGVTLLLALPLGIGAAIYLAEYAGEGLFKRCIITMIDMTSGIPSIIFGFCGAVIFIPFVTAIGGKSGYTVLAGALTMTIVLLPTIIKTTTEALLVIPKHYTMASLSLGASRTQTVFKVILPNSIPGIMTATLLSIGRIIGESAALLFVMGSNISDSAKLMGQSTSLALHIWSITSGEYPNYATASAISIIILLVVFILSITVKLLSKKMNKMVV